MAKSISLNSVKSEKKIARHITKYCYICRNKNRMAHPVNIRVKEVARERGISLHEIAEKIGISPQSLYNMLGHDNVSVKQLEKYADAIGVPVSIFFTNQEKLSYG